jgi:hypothetical protein
VIFSSLLHDHALLAAVLGRIHSLSVHSKRTRFSLTHALELTERFPSLIHLKLTISSMRIWLALLIILFNGLPNLVHVKIHSQWKTFFDDQLYLIDDIARRRRQVSPQPSCKAPDVSVKVNKEGLDVYLDDCPICVEKIFCT